MSVGVTLTLTVGVWVGDDVAVTVAVNVAISVAVAVGVKVRVGDDVTVTVAVGVGVAVAAETHAAMLTSSTKNVVGRPSASLVAVNCKTTVRPAYGARSKEASPHVQSAAVELSADSNVAIRAPLAGS